MTGEIKTDRMCVKCAQLYRPTVRPSDGVTWLCGVCESEIFSLFPHNPPWPWQVRGFLENVERIEAGRETPWCVTGPTGSGKSDQTSATIQYVVNKGLKVAFFINRNLLFQQTINNLDRAGISYGCRGAEFRGYENGGAPVQICSVPTERSRVFKVRDEAVDEGRMDADEAREYWGMPDADVVFVDEAHMNTGPTMGRIVSEYIEAGARIIFYTATPLGINHLCDELIVAGTKKECREHDALVNAITYGSPEIETSNLKRNADGEFSERVKRQIWDNRIFGYILQEWKRLNPDARMCLGFGPDVAGSTWLASHFHNPGSFFTDHQRALDYLKLGREWQVAAASEFYRHGVSSAHIDGSNVWVDCKEYKGDKSAREDVLARWRDNEIKILWNRWVLREGLDFPELYHLILAVPIGKITTYDQITGRVLRWSKATPDAVIIQDHAANYWRHGSPNADRNWQEYFDLPPKAMTDARFDDMRDNKIKQPIICGKCGSYRTSGPKCWQCGHESAMTRRLVLQADGSLQEVQSNGLRPRRVTSKANTQALWDRKYWAARNAHGKLEGEIKSLCERVASGDAVAAVALESKQQQLTDKIAKSQTFNQLYSKFFIDHGYYPPRDLNNMPEKVGTWYRKVRDTDHRDVKMPPMSNQDERSGERQGTLDLDNLPEKPF